MTKKFSDFGIKPVSQGLTGDKVKIDRVLNKEITVTDYRIVDSKFTDKGNGKCLHLQIEIDNTQRVIFTGSATLMEMIQRVPKSDFPFTVTIVRENERFEFR
jgi:hypothetical protein